MLFLILYTTLYLFYNRLWRFQAGACFAYVWIFLASSLFTTASLKVFWTLSFSFTSASFLFFNEALEARWLTKDTLNSVKWLPADIMVVEEMKQFMV